MPIPERGPLGPHCRIRGADCNVVVRSIAARLLIAAVVGAGLCGRGAAAQPRSVEEIAQYQGADRQALLEAGSRREGHLMIYTTGTQLNPVYQAFSRKYPFVKVEAVHDDVPIVSRRMIEEYGAQTYLVDVVELTTSGLHPLRDTGLLQPYQSPQLAEIRAEAIEPGRHWAIDYESYVSLGYNTKLVSDAEAPKTLDDLLDPKWKGRMAVASATSAPDWIGAVLREKDESFLRRLAQQHVRIYEMLARAVANFIVSGEVALSPTIFSSHIANSRQDGASVAWRALGGVYANSDGAALAHEAPHPNAAMLYIDFVLSREGQALFQKLGYASARKDVDNPEKPVRIYYLGDEPDYLQNYEKWMALARQVFGQ
jgi:iron(III) transport system substrate-binding protein